MAEVFERRDRIHKVRKVRKHSTVFHPERCRLSFTANGLEQEGSQALDCGEPLHHAWRLNSSSRTWSTMEETNLKCIC